MDEHKPSIETQDDTRVDKDVTESDLEAPNPETSNPDAQTTDAQTTDAQTGESSVELAIEMLAGVDAAEAPDLADEVASRLRAQLSDN